MSNVDVTINQGSRKSNVPCSGFTLIEIVVATAIFVASLTAVAGIFTYSTRAQEKTKSIQSAQADARFAIELMAQMVRRGTVDYDALSYTEGIDVPSETLALLSETGERVVFSRVVTDGRGTLAISINGAASEPITPSELTVDIAHFYISPVSNPFSANPTENQQPLVTMVLATSPTSERETVQPTYIQTTVSSRQYVR